MSLATDIKYASIISPFVRNFKRVRGNYNFSCPICGDSSRTKSKARAYLYRSGDKLTFCCFNCNSPTSFSQLLNLLDPSTYKEYVQENFNDRFDHKPKPKQPASDSARSINQLEFLTGFASLTPAKGLSAEHPARQYVTSRRLPIEEVFYTSRWLQTCNEIDPSSFPLDYIRQKEDYPRIVVLLRDANGSVFGAQGRKLSPQDPNESKYQTLFRAGYKGTRVYGLDKIDFGKRVYITEAPYDSMFIANCLASCGGNIDTLASQLPVDKKQIVVIYDNEPRSKFTVSKIAKSIELGFSVSLIPSRFSQKDINDMIIDGIDRAAITEIINTYTFNGLQAKLELAKWRRI